MRKERPAEPFLRSEESLFHPADITLDNLHSQALIVTKELFAARQELIDLKSRDSSLQKKVSQKHDELMEILKVKEKIYRAIQDNKS